MGSALMPGALQDRVSLPRCCVSVQADILAAFRKQSPEAALSVQPEALQQAFGKLMPRGVDINEYILCCKN